MEVATAFFTIGFKSVEGLESFVFEIDTQDFAVGFVKVVNDCRAKSSLLSKVIVKGAFRTTGRSRTS